MGRSGTDGLGAAVPGVSRSRIGRSEIATLTVVAVLTTRLHPLWLLAAGAAVGALVAV